MTKRVEYIVLGTLLLIAIVFAASDITHSLTEFFQRAGKIISSM